MPYELNTIVKFRGRPVTIVSRCYVAPDWLYGVRFKSGKVVDYIPGRMLSV